jgi:hypothetical protein
VTESEIAAARAKVEAGLETQRESLDPRLRTKIKALIDVAIRAEIEEKRADKDFQRRLKRCLEEDREVLRRLSR